MSTSTGFGWFLLRGAGWSSVLLTGILGVGWPLFLLVSGDPDAPPSVAAYLMLWLPTGLIVLAFTWPFGAIFALPTLLMPAPATLVRAVLFVVGSCSTFPFILLAGYFFGAFRFTQGLIALAVVILFGLALFALLMLPSRIPARTLSITSTS